DMPTGTATAPGAVPAWLVFAGRFPEHEIGRIFLVALHGDPRAGDVVLEIATRELAVIGHGIDTEQHFATGLVSMAARDQALDDFDHSPDMLCGARLDRRR